MANNSTDELMNAAHHLVLARKLESRAPRGSQSDAARISDALWLVEQMLEERHAAPEYDRNVRGRLRLVWPHRVR